MTRSLTAAVAFTVFVLAHAGPAMAAPLLFTDRAAFNLIAQPGDPLHITSVDISGGFGNIRVTFGDILPVIYDSEGLFYSNCRPNPLANSCTSFAQGGGIYGSNFSAVLPFLTPVMAVGYEVVGTFGLFGQVIEATTPQFFGFVFDTPTTILPLPQIVALPGTISPGSQLPVQGAFNVQNIVVSTPEPATLTLFGAAAGLLVGRRRRARANPDV